MKNRSLPKHALDNRANQQNPTHPAYHRSRGASPADAQQLADQEQSGNTPIPNAEPIPGATPEKVSR